MVTLFFLPDPTNPRKKNPNIEIKIDCPQTPKQGKQIDRIVNHAMSKYLKISHQVIDSTSDVTANHSTIPDQDAIFVYRDPRLLTLYQNLMQLGLTNLPMLPQMPEQQARFLFTLSQQFANYVFDNAVLEHCHFVNQQFPTIKELSIQLYGLTHNYDGDMKSVTTITQSHLLVTTLINQLGHMLPIRKNNFIAFKKKLIDFNSALSTYAKLVHDYQCYQCKITLLHNALQRCAAAYRTIEDSPILCAEYASHGTYRTGFIGGTLTTITEQADEVTVLSYSAGYIQHHQKQLADNLAEISELEDMLETQFDRLYAYLDKTRAAKKAKKAELRAILARYSVILKPSKPSIILL